MQQDADVDSSNAVDKLQNSIIVMIVYELIFRKEEVWYM